MVKKTPIQEPDSDDELVDFEDEEEIEENEIEIEDIDEDTPKKFTDYADDSDEELDDNFELYDLTENDFKQEQGDVVSKEARITKPFLNKYEKTRVLSTRTRQIALGAKPLIKINSSKKMTPYEIAKLELKEKMTPLIIKRVLPSGKTELFTINELEDLES